MCLLMSSYFLTVILMGLLRNKKPNLKVDNYILVKNVGKLV